MQPLPNHKLKVKLPLQRSCNEKDEKGKICGGHLKRWFYAVDTVERACGDIDRILAARNRGAAGATAPAAGLCLVSVEY